MFRKVLTLVAVLVSAIQLPALSNTTPAVTQVAFTPSAISGSLYLKPEQSAELEVRFSEPVVVSGAPSLTLRFDGYDYDAPFVRTSDDGTSLIFSVTANTSMCYAEGGVYGAAESPSLKLQGGTISSASGVAALLEIDLDADIMFYEGGLWIECAPPLVEIAQGDLPDQVYLFFSAELESSLNPAWFSYSLNGGPDKPVLATKWEFWPYMMAALTIEESPAVGDVLSLSYNPGGLTTISGYSVPGFSSLSFTYESDECTPNSPNCLYVPVDPGEYYEPSVPVNPVAPPSGGTTGPSPSLPVVPEVVAPEFKSLPAPNLKASTKLRPQPAYSVKGTDANEEDFRSETRKTTLSWAKVSGAKDYKIYYQSEYSSSWTLAKDSVSSSNKATYNGLVSAKDVFLSVATITDAGQSHDPTKGDLNMVQVDVGDHHACSVAKSGMVWCWGSSYGYGELGSYFEGSGAKGVIVTGVAGATKVQVGDYHSCALASGKVYCWGANFAGQLGFEGQDSAVAVEVELPAKATDIAVGARHSCAVAAGKVYCWGANGYGQLGEKGKKGMVEVAGVSAKSVAAGDFESCAVATSGDLYCWGADFEGTQYEPTKSLESVSSAAVGAENVCAILNTGELWCRGKGEFGQLGNSANVDSTDFVKAAIDTKVKQVAIGQGEICALDQYLMTFCWGEGIQRFDLQQSEAGSGEYALDTVSYRFEDSANPTAALGYSMYASLAERESFELRLIYVEGARDPKSLALGDSASCAIDYLGRLYCNSESTDGIKRDVWDEEEPYSTYSSVGFAPFITLMGIDHYSPPGGLYAQNYEATSRPTISGSAKVGSKLSAKLPSWAPASKHVGYRWLISESKDGFYSVATDARSASYTPRPQDEGKWLVLQIYSTEYKNYWYDVLLSKPVQIAAGTTQVVTPEGTPFGWTKRLSDTQAKLYAKDIIGAGKVVFKLNGKEIAWVNAADASDPKLRIVGDANYLVRTVNLAAGKNVLEVFINGERVKRTIYSR